jgi:hypothetical protein
LVTLSLVWCKYLTPSQFMIVGWLIANTYARNRDYGCYSLNQMMYGIPKRDGTGMWCEGTQLGRRTLIREIAALKAMELLIVTPDSRGSVFHVNLNWPAEEENNVVKFPKRLAHLNEDEPETGSQGSANLAPPPCQFGTPSTYNLSTHNLNQRDKSPDAASPSRNSGTLPGKNSDPSHRKLSKEKQEGQGKALPPVAPPPLPAIDRLAEKVEAVKARPKRKRGTFEETWREAWRETYPGVADVGWSVREKGMWKGQAKKWGNGEQDAHDFLHWVVCNWSAMISSRFAWMSKDPPPPKPEVSFLVRFLRYFQPVWADKEHSRWLGAGDGTDIEIKRRIEAGMTHDAAVLDLAKSRAIVHTLEEVDQIKAKAEQDKMIAKRLRDEDRLVRERETRFKKPEPTRKLPRPAEHDHDLEFGHADFGDFEDE